MRGPEIAFTCPGCGREATSGLEGRGHCARCGRETALDLSTALQARAAVDRCPLCQGEQMYVQRDFNQKAGLVIVIIGAVLAPFTPFYSSLFVAAAIDAVLYLLLPEITICYRCGTHFRGFPRNPRHQAYDLHIAEQYGTPGRRS
jgi:DNA-directed RNA polymerase subunit RPC12/RpoP